MAVNKKPLKEFADRWRGKGYEKGETQQFWLQLLKELGYPYSNDVLFERHLPSGGFIDVWLRDASTLIEQKSLGVDLDKPEPRQGKLKTPLEQALDYVDELPLPEQPRFVVTCNFATFRVYDRNLCGRSELAKNAFEFTLDELADHPERLAFINDPANSRLEKEKRASIRAGELVGKLYDKLRAGYLDPDSEENQRALNVLCVRIVFCLYCEDADLFEKDAFYNYLKDLPATGIRKALKDLFRALDTPIAERDPYDLEVKNFPYVNGGLFKGESEIPNFTEDAKRFLLEEASKPVDWSQISPTIFGGIFESTLNPETRRSGGMHYTSPENIHKVIDPLFLDALKEEFAAIRDEVGATPRKKKAALANFHKKLCSLKFLDPACGSGNFLTETYLCLRKLEDAVLRELWKGQTAMGFGDEALTGARVNLGQFYGIEINDFAVAVARTALWISRLKANGETSMFIEMGGEDFPLSEAPNIVLGNALRLDWNDVLPAGECSFIMGNPPFVGHQYRTSEQQADMDHVFQGVHGYGKLDYVCAWYQKSAKYIQKTEIHCSLVSTNSICQGESVGILWRYLTKEGFVINFAHTSFVWDNEASNKARVHVVILGFSCREASSVKKTIYDALGHHVEVDHINGYLSPAPDVYIANRSRPVNDGVHEMIKGNQPTDGGHLILSSEERVNLVQRHPDLNEVIRPFVGGREFLNGEERWCLWFYKTDISRYSYPEIEQRLKAVRETRLSSPTASVREDSKTPHLFTQIRQPDTNYLALPQVSSERREYIPIGYLTAESIVSNLLYVIPDASLYIFGLMTSQMHNAWMRVVAGRLECRYRYAPAVYNSFVFPNATPDQRAAIEQCAQSVLDARANHPGKSLADLYDPDKTPGDLLSAHKALDRAVESAYGVDFGGDEEKIVAHLFKLYAEKTAGA